MSAPRYRGAKTTEAEVFTREDVELLYPGTDPRHAVALLVDRNAKLGKKTVEARSVVGHQGSVKAIILVSQVTLPELKEE